MGWLINHFGQKTGAWMFHAAHGQDERPIVLDSEPVSISRETTFDRDLHAVRDKAELGAIFTRLCQQVADDLQRKGYVGKTIGIKLRYDDFKSVTRDQTLDVYIADAQTIRHTAGLCLKRVSLQQRLRLLGVRVGSLTKVGDAGALQPNASSRTASPESLATDLATANSQLF
jgi:DNA polymerase-4